MRPAVFLDRDGTLIESVHYLRRVDDVRLLPGVGAALRALAAAGYALVVVTNQAAIGKGLLTVEGLHEIHAELERRLATEGVTLDGWYFCDVVRRGSSLRVVEHPDRKPGAGMLLRAARELDLDVPRSWMVGDSISDALAGRNAGCRGTILVLSGLATDVDERDPAIDHVAADLRSAAQVILQGNGALSGAEGAR